MTSAPRASSSRTATIDSRDRAVRGLLHERAIPVRSVRQRGSPRQQQPHRAPLRKLLRQRQADAAQPSGDEIDPARLDGQVAQIGDRKRQSIVAAHPAPAARHATIVSCRPRSASSIRASTTAVGASLRAFGFKIDKPRAQPGRLGGQRQYRAERQRGGEVADRFIDDALRPEGGDDQGELSAVIRQLEAFGERDQRIVIG